MRLRSADQLVLRPRSWLWLYRLALGELALLEGDPGLGKSLLMLDLCARLSTGRTCPDDSPGPGKASAVVLTAEDSPEETVLPRLQAAGADLARVFVLTPENGGGSGKGDGVGNGEGDSDGDEPLSFPSRAALLDRVLAQTGARLVVIDLVADFLDPGINAANYKSVRSALRPLARLAARHRCAIVLLRHLKKGGGKALYRGLDSIAFLAACRSAWLVALDPQAPGRLVLAQQKNNLASPQGSLAFELVGPKGAAPAVSWLGPCDWTAQQLLAAAPPSAPLPQRDRAREFLETFLADGPRTSREVWAAAQEQGLHERTLYRAKREGDIRSVWVSLNGTPVSYWLLDGQKLPDTVPPEAVPPDLEDWLGPLRERFPPTTPLDDL
jgi:hypothetical protein